MPPQPEASTTPSNSKDAADSPGVAGQDRAHERQFDVTSALVTDSGFSDLNAVLRDTCNRFSRVTGWLLTFQRAEGELADALEQRLKLDDETYWYARIRSGYSTIGMLSIVRNRNAVTSAEHAVLPEETQLTSRLRRLVFPLADACDAAEIIVNLLNQIATRSQILSISERSENPITGCDRNARHRLDVLRFLSGHDAVALFLLEDGELRLSAASGIRNELMPEPHRMPEEENVDALAMKGQEALVVDGKNKLVPDGYDQAICLALDRRKQHLGTLWFYSREGQSTERIEQTVSLAGRFAATFDDMAVLRIAKDNTDLRRDLRMLRRIQDAAALETPRDLTLDVGHFSQPHSEVNGDLYEQLALDEHRTFFAIGDACGHGLPAAVITSAVRSCLRCLTIESETPPGMSDLLRVIGNAITSTTPTYMFMTLFVGIVDSKNNRLSYSTAGHPSPIVIRDSGDSDSLPGNGLLLGVMRNADYFDFDVAFGPGDTLIAYSDGLTEARNQGKELFQTEGISKAVKRQGHASSSNQLVDAIVNDAIAHSETGFPDDVTLLVVKRTK